MNLTESELTRYGRHINIDEIGINGQQRIKDSKVLIIGAGGLGSPAAMYLAAAGVGTIGIADADNVELSNLQRQVIHITDNVGKPKVESAKEQIEKLNPLVKVKLHPEFVNEKNIDGLIADYDFVLDCTDNYDAKFLINDACVRGEKAFCHAAVIRFQGELLTYVPNRGPCYRCAMEEAPAKGSVKSNAELGVMGPLVGMFGCMQALEAIKFITGQGRLSTGCMLTYDALNLQFHRFTINADEPCSVCRHHKNIK